MALLIAATAAFAAANLIYRQNGANSGLLGKIGVNPPDRPEK